MRNHVILSMLLVACGSKTEGTAKSGDAADPAVSYVMGSATEDLAKLKTALTSPKPSDARYSCAQMANIETLRKGDAKVAAELEQICTQDLHVAIIKVAVETAEAARKAQPAQEPLSECFSADYSLALSELQKSGKADVAKELVGRWKAACPKSE